MSEKQKKRWGVQFWDFGEWNWISGSDNRGGVYENKKEAVSIAQGMNRRGEMQIEGHRVRVREYKE